MTMSDRFHLTRFVCSLFDENNGVLSGRHATSETIHEFAQSNEAIKLADEFIQGIESQWLSFSRAEPASFDQLTPEPPVIQTNVSRPPSVPPLVATPTHSAAEPAPAPLPGGEATDAGGVDENAAAVTPPTKPAGYEESMSTLDQEVAGPNVERPATETELPATTSPTSGGTLRLGEIPHGPKASPAPLPPPAVRFSIPRNAKVGEAFESPVESSLPVYIKEVRGAEEVGVTYEPQGQVLKGTVSAVGDHRLYVRFTVQGRVETFEAPAILTVIPDPKALWRNLLSDRNDPLWKPDEDSQFLQSAEGLRLAGASKRGRSHAHVGSCRDDDFCLHTKEGWQILAVADGAGSAERSRRGSAIAIQEAGNHVASVLAGETGRQILDLATVSQPNLDSLKRKAYEVLGQAAFNAAKAIEEEAKREGVGHKEYSTTLLIAFHRRTERGHLIATYWVGDGAIGAYHKDNRVDLLGEVDSGEYAGQTRFLERSLMQSGEDVMKRIQVTLAHDLTALILMTDGVTDPKFETDRNLETHQRWDALWQELEPLLQEEAPHLRLIEWLDFWSPGNHDDRTIALLWEA